MAVRKFNMPSSLNETLASKPDESVKERQDKATRSFTPAQSEPLASQKKEVKPGITFAAQDKLPKLPIPELSSTCDKYLEALKPLQTPREQEETTAAVREFARRDGPILQERLKKYATGKTSYIEQFCKCPTVITLPPMPKREVYDFRV